MEKELCEKREECILWYMERGNSREQAETIVPCKPDIIRFIYAHMMRQKQLTEGK